MASIKSSTPTKKYISSPLKPPLSKSNGSGLNSTNSLRPITSNARSVKSPSCEMALNSSRSTSYVSSIAKQKSKTLMNMVTKKDYYLSPSKNTGRGQPSPIRQISPIPVSLTSQILASQLVTPPSMATPRWSASSPITSRNNMASSPSISFTPNPNYLIQQKEKERLYDECNLDRSNGNSNDNITTSRTTPRMIESGCQTQEISSPTKPIASVRPVSGLTQGLQQNGIKSVAEKPLHAMSSKELVKLFDSNYNEIMSQGYVTKDIHNKNIADFTWTSTTKDETVETFAPKSFDEFGELRQSLAATPNSHINVPRVSAPDPSMMLKGNRQNTSAPSNALINLINSIESGAMTIGKPEKSLATKAEEFLSCISPQSNGTSTFFDISARKEKDIVAELMNKRNQHSDLNARIITPRKSSLLNTPRLFDNISPHSSASNSSFIQSPRSAFILTTNSTRSTGSSNSAFRSYRSVISDSP